MRALLRKVGFGLLAATLLNAGAYGYGPCGTTGQIQTNGGNGRCAAINAPSGAVVGTSDTQTLTNKTISGSSNTITNIQASSLPFSLPIPVASGGTGGVSYSQIARKIALNLPSLMTAVVDGDSITFGSSSYNNGVPTFGQTSYINNALLASGRFTLLNNAGVAGQTCAQMLAALPTAVIAYHPNVAVILIGTNDLVGSPTNSSYSALMNCQEQVVISLLDNNILPVLVTIPPKNDSAVMAKEVQWFQYQLASYYGISVIDIYKVLADPTSGQYVSGDTIDGTHPSITAVAALLPIEIAVLQNINAPAQYPYSGTIAEQSTGDPSNLIANGVFDFGPMNTWSTNTGAYTYTNPAAVYPYTGNQSQAVALGSGAAYILAGSSFNVTGGHKYYGFIRVKTAGLVPATANGYQVILLATVSSNLVINSVFNLDSPYAFKWTAPLSETSYSPQLYTNGDASTTYNIDNWTVVDVTAQNAIWQPGQQNIP